jgi:hypothetical protein
VFDYWGDVLVKLGYRLPYLQGGTVPVQTPSKEEARVLSDPLFQKFLELLNADWGQGPGSVSSFMKLPEDERLIYLAAFQNWKENLQKKGIKVA